MVIAAVSFCACSFFLATQVTVIETVVDILGDLQQYKRSQVAAL
jgi:hypothetical protein